MEQRLLRKKEAAVSRLKIPLIGDSTKEKDPLLRDARAEKLPITPYKLKERLIFGSTDDDPESSGSVQDENLWDSCRISSSESRTRQALADSVSMNVSTSESFSDSLLDSRTHTEQPKFSNDLTRTDLDVRLLDSSESSLIPSTHTLTSVSEDRELDIDDKEFHVIHMPSSSSTTNEPLPKGDIDWCITKQLRRIRTAPSLFVKHSNRLNTIPNEEAAKNDSSTAKSIPSSGFVVTQAFVGLLLYLAVGVVIYSWREDEFSGSSTHYLVDALYFCIVTMCTIGYGDITPVTPFAKLFSCVFVLVGFGFIDVLLSGMVSYVLDKQEMLLLNSFSSARHEDAKDLLVDTEKGRLHIDPRVAAKDILVDTEKGRMRIRSKVVLAFGVVILCIGVGTLVMHFLESLGWLDSFYLSCMSVTTVGYGDHAFKTTSGRLFASIWLLVSTLAVARSFIFLAESRIDKRHRLIAKVILEKDLTAIDFVAADLDNDGYVSKSDFVVYKLKQMGRILEKDIAEVCKQFNRLDTGKTGKITLSKLVNLHESSVPRK